MNLHKILINKKSVKIKKLKRFDAQNLEIKVQDANYIAQSPFILFEFLLIFDWSFNPLFSIFIGKKCGYNLDAIETC